jgi:uncharacterized coiled-coil protein SlyX
MVETGAPGAGTAALLARLDALAGQIAEQSERLDQQAAIIAAQRQQLTSQQAKIDRLTQTASAVGQPPSDASVAGGTSSGRRVARGRRAMMSRLLGASAAGALLAVAREAGTARADFRGTATGGGTSTANYGLVATPNAGTDPSTNLPLLNGTKHGLIGTLSASSPTTGIQNAGVTGLASAATDIGVQGFSNADGVVGRTAGSTLSTAGVRGYATAGVAIAVFGQTTSTTDQATAIIGQAVGASGNTIGVSGSSPTGTGVFGSTSSGFGVSGLATVSGTGVLGTVASGSGSGVSGLTVSTSNLSAGVRGTSPNGPGVYGSSTTLYGVQGLSANAYGVSGNSTTQAGVWGSSNTNTGVLGSSISGVGVSGLSQSSNGVNGLSTSGIGVYGSSSGGFAGRFDGNVFVNGNLTVSGTFPQSAAVQSSDGTLRRVYSMESPEVLYEDVGQGSLTNGVGSVTIDPAFAALILGDTYHVFLTPRGDCNGLYLSAQGPTGFEVRELRNGTSSIGFSYRIVARPQSGASPRLDRVDPPPPPTLPRLDRVEPLDVPATLRDFGHPDIGPNGPGAPPSRVRD